MHLRILPLVVGALVVPTLAVVEVPVAIIKVFDRTLHY